MKSAVATAVLTLAAASFGVSVAASQIASPPTSTQPAQFTWPAEMKNRKVLPPGTGGPALAAIMKGFSQSLGVRCTHCHVGEEGKPLTTYDFASDARPEKETARAMLRLVHRLNTQDLPAVPGLEAANVTCYTCHRGATEPAVAPPPTAPTPATPSSERG